MRYDLQQTDIIGTPRTITAGLPMFDRPADKPISSLNDLPDFNGVRPRNTAGKALDILTPRGQRTAKDEAKVARYLQSVGVLYAITPKSSDCAVDAVIVKLATGSIIAVAETKCRYGLSYHHFRTSYNNEWIVTERKVLEGLAMASALRVPFWGICYLVDDDVLLVQKDMATAPHRVERTATRATVNGGTAMRENRYISMGNVNPVFDMLASVAL